MKVISDRISILKKENLLSIVILPVKDKKKMTIMFLWLLAWTVCGIIVLANYFQLTNQSTKLFIIVYLSFWVYFEYKIARAFSWKKNGKEKIWIADGQLNYLQEIYNRGKVKSYDANLISQIKLVEKEREGFSEFINSSFWMKGTENIEVEVQGKKLRFGYQLNENEARSIVQELRQFMKKQ